MGFFKGPEIIKKMIKTGIATVQLPSGSNLLIGGQGYKLSTSLTCDTSVSGINGLDTGSIAINTFYYVYAVINSNTVYLTASISNEFPTGFTAYKKVGAFQIDGNGDVLYSYFFGDSIDTDWTDFVATGNMTVNTDYSGKWGRDGDDIIMQLRADFTGAPSPVTTSIGFDLPFGLSENAAKITYGNVLLSGLLSDSSSGRLSITQAEVASGLIYPRSLILGSANTHYTTSINSTSGNPVTVASGDVIDIIVRLPIIGWSKEIDWNNY